MSLLLNSSEEHAVAKAVLFFFFPPKCALCGESGHEALCPPCRSLLDSHFEPRRYLPFGGSGFADEMITLFPYDCLPVKKLLFQWKREDYRDLPLVFGPYVARAKGLFPRDIDCVTFAPRRNTARRLEGFDQAERIARTVAEILGIPFRPLLSRRGFSLPQHKVPRSRRERNVRGVFSPRTALRGERILLVDDIVTTGAGAKECARILKKAGAMKVYVFSLAH